MPVTEPTVYVVDDDPDFVEVARVLLGKVGFHVVVYMSAEAFLNDYSRPPDSPCCLLLDIQLSGMSGLALLETFANRKIQIPVILLTGHADVATTVSAMKAGVLDVLEKPVKRQLLLERIRQGVDRDARQRCQHSNQVHFSHRLKLLSEREKEVMQLLLAGHSSKQIAGQLGITSKTVLRHRSHVLEKLEVESVVQLIRLLSGANDDTPLESNEPV